MAKRCAYCDLSAPMTKEHVWPDCFLDRTGRTAAHFSHKSGKVHGGDYLVADVCGYCNNKMLSPLDAYFCRLYDEYFSQVHGFHSKVVFRYDYVLLSRTLFKIAYNSARSAGSDYQPVANLRKSILGKDPWPDQVALFAELVSPTEVPDDTEPSGVRVVLPQGLYRSAITQLQTASGELVHTRVVAINSFYFHLMIPAAEMGNTQFEDIASEFPLLVRGAVRLRTESCEVVLESSPQDAITSFAPHVRAHSEQYNAFFAKRRGS